MPLLNVGPVQAFAPRQGWNSICLNAGETFLLTGGVSQVQLAKYHNFQAYDPITTTWRAAGSSNEGSMIESIWSDGLNYRLANQTGCVVGAYLINNGSGYTSAPTVAASSGGSKWTAVVGGAISTTVTITNGGLGYAYPPLVVFSEPSSPGIQATGYAAISNGVVTGVTVVDQGAGYIAPPTVTFLNDPRELQLPNVQDGYGAAAATALTGAGTITALLCTDHGASLGASVGALPTLTFTGGGGSSAAATAIMNLAVTALPTLSAAGATLPGTRALITSIDAPPTGSPTISNPSLYTNLIFSRSCQISEAIAGAALTNTGSIILDGGCHAGIPTPMIQLTPSQTAITTTPVVALTVGGITGATAGNVSFVLPV